jgi:Icc-related predicted phosphoesterase
LLPKSDVASVPPAVDLKTLRIAAIGDLHFGRHSPGAFHPLFADIADAADVLVICGDITDYGLVDEARAVARELVPALKIPIVAVLGNHDFESGQSDAVRDVLRESGVVVLDGDSFEIAGVGFAGVKGFCGGFGHHSLGSWGEPIVKQYVQEAMGEALKLETALARLRTPVKIALIHYAPVRDTAVGEPEEIFPFIGSSRLEEPLNRYQVTAAFHGHAHRGQPEGRTSTGIAVYNVALPLLTRLTPERPFRLLEVDLTSG